MLLGSRFVIKTGLNFTRLYSSWNNTKEFRKYMVDGKFLNLTHGLFTSSVAATKKDIQLAQALIYEYFQEANWEWAPDNPTGFRVLEDSHGVRYIKDKFEEQALWLTVHEGNNICGVLRLLFKFQTHETLDIMNYLPKELNYGRKQLKGFLNSVKLVEPQRLYVRPGYRGSAVPFMLRWCVYKSALIGNVDGLVTGGPYNYSRDHPQYLFWDFDYGDGVKIKLYFLHKAFYRECVDYFQQKLLQKQKKYVKLINLA